MPALFARSIAPSAAARRHAVREPLDAGRGEIVVPAIVLVELTLLREAGRNVIGVPQVEALLAAQPAFQLQPLELAQVMEFAMLDSLPDPFDRLIVAAARSADVPLISADTIIDAAASVRVNTSPEPHFQSRSSTIALPAGRSATQTTSAASRSAARIWSRTLAASTAGSYPVSATISQRSES